MLGLPPNGGAGIVDKNVETSEPLDDLNDCLPARRFLAHIHWDKFSPDTFRSQRLERRAGLGLIARSNRNGSAGGRQPLRHSKTNAAIAAGDEGDLSREVK